MQTLSLEERHPERHLGFIIIAVGILTGQHGRTLLIGERKNTDLRVKPFRCITGHTVAVHNQRSVLVEPDMLRADIHLDVGSVQIIRALPAQIQRISIIICLDILRLP